MPVDKIKVLIVRGIIQMIEDPLDILLLTA